jgi:hypothetical protein
MSWVPYSEQRRKAVIEHPTLCAFLPLLLGYVGAVRLHLYRPPSGWDLFFAGFLIAMAALWSFELSRTIRYLDTREFEPKAPSGIFKSPNYRPQK